MSDMTTHESPAYHTWSSVALAKCFEPNKHSASGMWMSEKLDGMRALWDGRQLVSRNGNHVHAPQSLLAELPSDLPLDGELWCGRGKFQTCISVARNTRADDAEWEQLRYCVFDTPGDDDYAHRMGRVCRALEGVASRRVCVLSWEYCEGDEHLSRALQNVEVSGGEGLILRDPRCGYPGGRTDKLLKVKSAHDAEARVVGHVAGKGKHAGRTGALLCEDLVSGVNFRLGTGLDDVEREDPPAVGSVVTYRYFERTLSGAPRFPVFVRQRPAE